MTFGFGSFHTELLAESHLALAILGLFYSQSNWQDDSEFGGIQTLVTSFLTHLFCLSQDTLKENKVIIEWLRVLFVLFWEALSLWLIEPTSMVQMYDSSSGIPCWRWVLFLNRTPLKSSTCIII